MAFMLRKRISSLFATVLYLIPIGKTTTALSMAVPNAAPSNRAAAAGAAGAAGALNQQRISVAVIGGGVAGLSCADRLSKSMISCDVTVYDTGRLRPGGRCSSRQVSDREKNTDTQSSSSSSSSSLLLSKYRYDHAAQIMTVPTSSCYADFANKVREWEENGTIRPFPPNSVYNIRSHKKVEPISGDMFYGTNGMGSIPTSIVKQNGGAFQLKQNVWVSPSNGARYMRSSDNNSNNNSNSTITSKWKVHDGTSTPPRYYDALVIAHNGKCADRLMSQTPATELHNLLRVNFAPSVPASGGTRMTLNSVYSLTFAIPRTTTQIATTVITDSNSTSSSISSRRISMLSKCLPDTFYAGFIHNHPSLRFLTCQTRKYAADNGDDNVEVWTVLSSAAFAKKYKAPQEFLPDETVARVSRLLLSAVEEAIVGGTASGNSDTKKRAAPKNNDEDAPSALESSVLDRRLQLWGAALPLNVWETTTAATAGMDGAATSSSSSSHQPAGFLYDADHRVGACGDWLVEASLAGAWTSGRLLADHMISHMAESHGLEHGAFRRSASVAKLGIGSLPS